MDGMQEKNARFLPVTCASSSSGRRLKSLAGREGKPVSAHDNDAGALASTTMQPASSQLRRQKRLSVQLADELRKPAIPSALRPAPPEQIPPDKLPDPWLFDSGSDRQTRPRSGNDPPDPNTYRGRLHHGQQRD